MPEPLHRPSVSRARWANPYKAGSCFHPSTRRGPLNRDYDPFEVRPERCKRP